MLVFVIIINLTEQCGRLSHSLSISAK